MILQINKNPQHDSSLQSVQPNHVDYISTADGRWHRRRYSEYTRGMSLADGVVWTRAVESREPPPSERGGAESGKPLEVSLMRLTPGGEENSSDPTMIGYNEPSHKVINNISFGHWHKAYVTQWGPICPVLVP